MTEPATPVDLDELRAELIAGLEQLAEHLLGVPPIRRARYWRWGRKGSLALVMSGHKRGAWSSYEEGYKGGGPFQLVMHARSCTLPEAIRWAQDWTGYTPQAGDAYKAEAAARQAERDRKAREAEAEDRREATARVAYARRLWAGSVPLAGTVAERYLTVIRGVPDMAWPDMVRFDPRNHALIVAVTDDTGAVQAVQRVHLTPDAMKAPSTDTLATKHTNGVGKGASVRLPGAADGPLLLAEGPETGLSVWAATGHETWIGLGSVGNVPAPAGRRIVVCRDDDPRHSPADKAHMRIMAGWREAGLSVAVATPWPFRLFDRSDFADVGLQDGPAAIRARIEAALNPGGGPGGGVRLPINQVRRELARAIDTFMTDAEAWDAKQGSPPEVQDRETAEPDDGDWGTALATPLKPAAEPDPMPVHAIRVTVGAGKTVYAIRALLRRLQAMRAAGDKRSVAIAVPTHKLGEEQAAVAELHAREAGLSVAVWRGMGADDPEAPGEKMCRRLDAVADARKVHAEVRPTCCIRKLDDGCEVKCPFFDGCGYERQRDTRADLWLLAHELLFAAKPAALGRVALLVVDESPWAAGLEGTHGPASGVSLDALATVPAGGLGELARVELQYFRDRLLDVLRTQPDGPLSAAAMKASQLTGADITAAHTLEWQRLEKTDMHPGMSAETRKQAAARVRNNALVPQQAKVWKALRPLLEEDAPERSGWLALATHHGQDTGPVRVLETKGRRAVKLGWQVPTLHLDAIADPDLLRPFWPTVELVAELEADAPHQHVRQVVDRAFGKSALDPLTEDMEGFTPEKAQRRTRTLRSVHAVLNREARRHDEAPVLVVAQKGVKEALPGFGPMATCIDLAHHNAVAGRDQWRNVGLLAVVGRTQPAPAAVERITEALTGCAVARLKGWYQRGDAVRHTMDGAVAIDADRHPDPMCERVRWQIAEGELIQIVGRARGVNRGPDDPVDILVMTDTPLPIPVEATLSAADLAPGPDDFMLAAGGVVFENPTDAAAAYPQLWGNREAAKKALQRARTEGRAKGPVGDKPVIEGTYTGMSPTGGALTRVDYQLAQERKSRAVAWVDAALIADPEARLTGMLGALAWCQVERPDPEPPPSPSAPKPGQEPMNPVRPGGEVVEVEPVAAGEPAGDAGMEAPTFHTSTRAHGGWSARTFDTCDTSTRAYGDGSPAGQGARAGPS